MFGYHQIVLYHYEDPRLFGEVGDLFSPSCKLFHNLWHGNRTTIVETHRLFDTFFKT
jgi:hypothetical protein